MYSDWIHSFKGKDGGRLGLGGGGRGGGLLQKEVGEMNRKAGEGSGKTAWRGGRRGKSGVTLTVGQWEGGKCERQSLVRGEGRGKGKKERGREWLRVTNSCKTGGGWGWGWRPVRQSVRGREVWEAKLSKGGEGREKGKKERGGSGEGKK